VPTLLVEIGCEELPASACREAERQLRDRFLPRFGGKGTVYVGPRRLALIAEDVPERTEDAWVKGPPENLREKAAAGFARKHGVAPEDLELRDGFLGLMVPGRSLHETLPAEVETLVRSMAFGKSMAWVAGGLRFARPVRWLCVKLEGDTVNVDVDGIASGGVSRGHRFTHGEVEIPSAGGYLDALRAAGVEPDQNARRSAIEDGLRELGLTEPNPRVLGEVVFLVESPIVLEGSFDERFLALPERVVTTAMESHQRYFPLGGNRFAFAANGGDTETVVRGNERVLAGRLEDASSGTSPAGSRRSRRISARSPSLRAPGRSPTRRSASSRSWTRSAAERRPARRRVSPRPTRRRSSCASSPTSRGTSAPSTRA